MATVRREDFEPGKLPQLRSAEAKQENVFDFLQNRILTHYPQAVQILRREMPEPRMAIVYPTYVCNQDCTWCEYRRENTEHHSIMSNGELLGLMTDLHKLGVKGEPLGPAELLQHLREFGGFRHQDGRTPGAGTTDRFGFALALLSFHDEFDSNPSLIPILSATLCRPLIGRPAVSLDLN